MNSNLLAQLDLRAIREQFDLGANVTDLLKSQLGLPYNSPEIIEIAYDLQAGEYIDHALRNEAQIKAYVSEMANILSKEITCQDHVLDVGTGEMTTLSYLLRDVLNMPARVSALDISWSRLSKGRHFANEVLSDRSVSINGFVAEMAAIPFADASVDVIVSSHALEPNGSRLASLLSELMRVTRRALILFEPSYEDASEEGKSRMRKLGYISGLEQEVTNLGGRVLKKIPIVNVSNPLNPTYCFVIKPNQMVTSKVSGAGELKFTFPGTNEILVPKHGGLFSRNSGLHFSVLDGIPILKTNSAILASAISE